MADEERLKLADEAFDLGEINEEEYARVLRDEGEISLEDYNTIKARGVQTSPEPSVTEKPYQTTELPPKPVVSEPWAKFKGFKPAYQTAEEPSKVQKPKITPTISRGFETGKEVISKPIPGYAPMTPEREAELSQQERIRELRQKGPFGLEARTAALIRQTPMGLAYRLALGPEYQETPGYGPEVEQAFPLFAAAGRLSSYATAVGALSTIYPSASASFSPIAKEALKRAAKTATEMGSVDILAEAANQRERDDFNAGSLGAAAGAGAALGAALGSAGAIPALTAGHLPNFIQNSIARKMIPILAGAGTEAAIGATAAGMQGGSPEEIAANSGLFFLFGILSNQGYDAAYKRAAKDSAIKPVVDKMVQSGVPLEQAVQKSRVALEAILFQQGQAYSALRKTPQFEELVSQISGLIQKSDPSITKEAADILARKRANAGFIRGDVTIEELAKMGPLKMEAPAKAIETTAEPIRPEPKIPPVPETSKTLQLQVKSLEEGKSKAVLITPGETLPSPPPGVETLQTEVGTWLFDPKQISDKEIDAKVGDGSYGEILGHVESPKPEEGIIVSAKVGDVEAKTSVVSPENIDAQSIELQKQFPDAVIEVGGEPLAKEIIEKRQIGDVALIPSDKPMPTIPMDFETIPVKEGTIIYNPETIDEEIILEKSSEGKIGDLITTKPLTIEEKAVKLKEEIPYGEPKEAPGKGIEPAREERPEGVGVVGYPSIPSLAEVPPGAIPEGAEKRITEPPAEISRKQHIRRTRGVKHPVTGEGIQPTASRDDSVGNVARGVSVSPPGGKLPEGSGNYRITPEDAIGFGTPAQKYTGNIEAIKLLKSLEIEGRKATPEEQSILIKYIGWGSMPNVFNHWDKKFERQYNEIKTLLTEDEWRAADASTTNAHFTSIEVIDAMYLAIKKLGFKTGRILEPSMGVGHFFGALPLENAKGSTLIGVELDDLTGRIARQLYQNADIRIMGFEKTKLPDNFFDLIVGNVPFGNYPVYDPAYSKFSSSIHNYFFAKSIDKVRPGGVIAFITSHFTMDGVNTKIRRYVSDKANLIGAIRLPNTTFKKTAGTEVVTDIMFLRKRLEGEQSNASEWVDSLEQKIRGKKYFLNRYFIDNPHMMLGIPSIEGGLYTEAEFLLKPGEKPFIEAIAEAIAKLPENIMQPAIETPVFMPIETRPELKEGSITIEDGKVYVKHGDVLEASIEVPVKKVKAMLELRDKTRAVFSVQMNASSTDKAISDSQKELNTTYDAFYRNYGNLGERKNVAVFKSDPDYDLLKALEKFDPLTKTYKKSDIFTKRVIQPIKQVLFTETTKDALNVVMSTSGKVDIDRIIALSKKSKEDVINDLAGLIFEDPEKGWVRASEYLSGDVKHKLEAARAASAIDTGFSKNVEALEKVQPRDLMPGEITINMGSSWLDPVIMGDFVSDITGVSDAVRFQYVPLTSTWIVEQKMPRSLQSSVGNNSTWGTRDISAVEIIALVINGKKPTIKTKVGEDIVVDKPATLAAQEKARLIQEEFKKWIWRDAERSNVISKQYNDLWNNLIPERFDGSHLDLPGKSPEVILRSHQLDAVWRIIQTPNTLLAHAVGAGKTYTMIAAGMEMRRIGIRKKPMYVVPNHIVGQWAEDFRKLYPAANILTTTESDFQKDNRRQLMAKIATGDWDAVIVAHSSFKFLPMSDNAIEEFMRSQIRELEDTIEIERTTRGHKSLSVKEMEKAKRRLEVKLQKRMDMEKKDNVVSFEELGVDQLFVDEAHEFKNLFFQTKMTRIAGLPQSDSEKAFDMFMKIGYVQKMNNGAGVVFATGTPINNTMAEMFTLMRYLWTNGLNAGGLSQFDAWASMFGESVTRLELAPTGGKYVARTAFAKFINLPELLVRFGIFADVKTAEMLNLPIPKLKGDKAIAIEAPASEALRQYIQLLLKRADKIASGGVDPTDDNMLKVTNDGRKSALDMRLIDPLAIDDPSGKVNLFIDKAFEIWDMTKDKKLVQAAFIDISTPIKGKFNVYHDVKKKLISRGVPEQEIAFIHDFPQREEKEILFEKVRNGDVRILLGSTKKMGTGTNIQTKLVAEHHLDAPWRPDEVEQRDGRILRQGNQNKEVHIYRYVTKGSFDAYMWQTLLRKSKFIGQVMTGDLTVRNAEDVNGRALTAQEMLAASSDNPLIVEKIQNDIDIQQYEILLGAYQNEMFRMRTEIASLPGMIEAINNKIPLLEKDLTMLKKSDPKIFSLAFQGKTYTERKEAGEAIVNLANSLIGKQNIEIGEYKGFPLFINQFATGSPVYLVVKGNAQQYQGNVSESAVGTLASLDAHFSEINIASIIEQTEIQKALQEKKLKDLQVEIDKPFEHETKLNELQKRGNELDAILAINKDEAGTGDTEKLRNEESKNLQEPTEDEENLDVEKMVAEDEEARAYSESSLSDKGLFSDDVPVKMGSLGKVKPIQMPEIYRLARELGAVFKLKKLPKSSGLFKAKKQVGPQVILDYRVFENPNQAAKTMAHEVGHLVDWFADIPEAQTLARGNLLGRLLSLTKFMRNTFGDLIISNSDIKRELLAVSERWRPYDKSIASAAFKSYRNSSRELYADAISVLFNSPGILEEMAPKFYKEFFDNLDAKSEFKEQFFILQDLLAGKETALLEQRESDLRHGFAKAESLLKLKRQEADMRAKRTWERIRQEYDDKAYPIIKKWDEDHLDEIIPDDLNPKFLIDEISMIKSEQHAFLSQIDRKITKRLDDNSIERDDIGVYLALRRMATERKDIANPYGHTAETAADGLAHLKNKLGEEKTKILEESLYEFHSMVFSVTEQAAEAGLYNKEELDTKLRPNMENYATFAVVEHFVETGFISPLMQKQVGTLKEIADPYIATIAKTLALQRAIAEQRAKKATMDWLQQYHADEIQKAEVVNPGDRIPVFRHKPDFGLLEMYEDGKRIAFNVDPYIAKAFEHLDPGDVSIAVRILNSINRGIFHPLFITYNPGFAFYFNPLRDFFESWLLAPNVGLGTLLKAYWKALPTAVKFRLGVNDKLMDEMLANKAIDVPYNEIYKDGEDDFYSELLARHGFIEKKKGLMQRVEESFPIAKPVTAILKGVRFAGQVLESLSKIAGYNVRKAQGLKGKKLAYETRTFVGTPAYMRKGTKTQISNTLFMYSNVFIKGIERAAKIGTDPKTRGGFWFKLAMLALLPKLMMMLADSGDVDDELKDVYERIPEYDKTNYICIPVAKTDGGKHGWKTVYIRIPHPEIGRLVSGLFWKMGKALRGDATSWHQILDFGAGNMPNIAPPLTITAGWGQYLTGKNPYDNFRGRYVLPETEFKAGGWPALKKMIYWTSNQAGLTRLATYDLSEKTTFEIAMQITPLLNRVVKISDYGMEEKMTAKVREREQEKAEMRLARSPLVRAFFRNKYRLQSLKNAEAASSKQIAELNAMNKFYGVSLMPLLKRIESETEKGNTAEVERLNVEIEKRMKQRFK